MRVPAGGSCIFFFKIRLGALRVKFFADCYLGRQSAKEQYILFINIICQLSTPRAVGKHFFF